MNSSDFTLVVFAEDSMLSASLIRASSLTIQSETKVGLLLIRSYLLKVDLWPNARHMRIACVGRLCVTMGACDHTHKRTTRAMSRAADCYALDIQCIFELTCNASRYIDMI